MNTFIIIHGEAKPDGSFPYVTVETTGNIITAIKKAAENGIDAEDIRSVVESVLHGPPHIKAEVDPVNWSWGLKSAYIPGGTWIDVPVYDVGSGPLWILQNSMDSSAALIRAETESDAWNIAEDEFLPEADDTLDELKAEYGFRVETFRIIQPGDGSPERRATPEDYPFAETGAKFVRWEKTATPDPEAWSENELFCEAYGFRPNGPSTKDKHGHGIYQMDLNGEGVHILKASDCKRLGVTVRWENEETGEVIYWQ